MSRTNTLYLISFIFLLVIIISLFINNNEEFDLTIGDKKIDGDFDKTCNNCSLDNITNNLTCNCNNTAFSTVNLNVDAKDTKNTPVIRNVSNNLTRFNLYNSLQYQGAPNDKNRICIGGPNKPDNWTYTTVSGICNEERSKFKFSNASNNSGKIYHKTSNMCLRPAGRSGNGGGGWLQFAPGNECNSGRSNFTLNSDGTIKHDDSKNCIVMRKDQNPNILYLKLEGSNCTKFSLV